MDGQAVETAVAAVVAGACQQASVSHQQGDSGEEPVSS